MPAPDVEAHLHGAVRVVEDWLHSSDGVPDRLVLPVLEERLFLIHACFRRSEHGIVLGHRNAHVIEVVEDGVAVAGAEGSPNGFGVRADGTDEPGGVVVERELWQRMVRIG